MSEGESVRKAALPSTTLIGDFLRSSVGAKVIMAVTGLGLWAFVIVHLLGNLQIFQGADAINHYGVFLRELAHGAAIWVARGALILCFVLHIAFGIRLAAKNRAARPQGYRVKKRMRTTAAAMSMTVTGLLVLAFIVFHLAHTTWGLVMPENFITTPKVVFADGTQAHDVYFMMVKGFSHAWLVVVYIAGQLILLSHLYHGTASLWQSLGWHHPTWSPAVSLLARAIAAIIVVLNISMPVVLFLRGGAL
jgi:succinate dehydrogenase / fumarate reductase cytochrome b subunit